MNGRDRTIGRGMNHRADITNEGVPMNHELHLDLPARRSAAGRRRLVAIGAVVGLLVAGGCSGDDATTASTSAPADTSTNSSTDSSTDSTTGSDVTTSSTAEGAGDGTTTAPGGVVTTQPSTTLIGDTTVPGVTVPFTPGSLATVPVQTVVTAPPVAIDAEADAGTGMTFRLEALEAVTGEATGPGEIAGPAVRVTVVATNDSPSPVVLEGVVVDLTYGNDGTSAAPLSGPGVVRFSGEVSPGASATAVYVFDVPLDQRGDVSVLVSYLASVSPVVFEGPAPTE
jgi:hypothetical protein